MNLSEEKPETRSRQCSCFPDRTDCLVAHDCMKGVKREVFVKMMSLNLWKASRRFPFEHKLAMAVAGSDDSGRTKDDTWPCIYESFLSNFESKPNWIFREVSLCSEGEEEKGTENYIRCEI